MFNQEKLKKWMLYLFVGFMIAQPLFDIYILYSDDLISLFKFSPATIIRMLVMGILFITAFIWFKDKRKYKFFIVAAIIYIIYGIFHHLNSLAFYVPYGNFGDYSLLKEGFYLIRMIMPLLIIFITYEKNLSFKYFKSIIIWVSLIFGVTMVVTNFTGLALSSYDSGKFNQIQETFFGWFSGSTYTDYSYLDIASKGIFHMANQVSGVLLCLLPLILYFYFKEPKPLHVITLAVTILAMLMLGTRVASMGWLAVCILMLLLYLLFIYLKKEMQLNKKYLIIFLAITAFFAAVLPFSPVMNRTYINDNNEIIEEGIKGTNAKKDLKEFKKHIAEMEKKNLNKEEKISLKKEKVDFVKKYNVTFGTDQLYVKKIYSYKEDPDFWLAEFEIPFKERANHRQLKKDITKRVIELNDRPTDYIVGMSFTRLRNAPCYMENDIYVHMYSIGIVGIILFIVPYLLVLGYAIVKIFKDMKNKFNFKNISLIISVVLVFGAGIVSGNVFDEWIVTLFLGLICGMLLLSVNKKDEESQKGVIE